MPMTINFDVFQAALQTEWSQILYTKYRWTEHILDIVSNAIIDESALSVRVGELAQSSSATTSQQTIEEAWLSLRKERNIRLAACDWTQLPDAQLNDTEILIWRMYRQCLRDMPSNTVDAFNPSWPTTPQPI